AQTVSQMVDTVLRLPEDTRIMILAPIVQERKGEHVQVLENLSRQGYVRARINGEVYELDEAPKLDLRKKHTIEVIIDRLKVRPGLEQRLAESFETALQLADGLVIVHEMDRVNKSGDKSRDKAKDRSAVAKSMGTAEGAAADRIFSAKFACPLCGYSL